MANVVAAWADRYLDQPETMTESEIEAGLVFVRETHGGKFQQKILTGPHHLLADEPVKLGGFGSGPGPYDFLLAGLGACNGPRGAVRRFSSGCALLRCPLMHLADQFLGNSVFKAGLRRSQEL